MISTNNHQTSLRSEVEDAFANMAARHASAKQLLELHADGHLVSAPEAMQLVNQLRQANTAFAAAMDKQKIELVDYLNNRFPICISDFSALESFLKENGISEDPKKFAAGHCCRINKEERATRVDVSGYKSDTPFITEPLERLSRLTRLRLLDKPSDPAKLAKLISLEELDFRPLIELGLRGVTDARPQDSMSQHPQPTDEQISAKVCLVDISPLVRLNNLKLLKISDTGLTAKCRFASSLAPLCGLKFLECLELENVIVDKSLLYGVTSRLEALKTLRLKKCQIEDLSILDYMPSLENFEIPNSSISCSIVNYPPQLKKLALYYSDTDHFASLVRPLLKLKKLSEVELDGVNSKKAIRFTKKARSIINQLQKQPVRGGRRGQRVFVRW